MKKIKTTAHVYIDADLKIKAQELGIKLSEEFRDYLRIRLNHNIKEYKDLAQINKEIESKDKTIQQATIERNQLLNLKTQIEKTIQIKEQEQDEKRQAEIELLSTCILCSQKKDKVRALFGGRVCDSCFQATPTNELKKQIQNKLKLKENVNHNEAHPLDM